MTFKEIEFKRIETKNEDGTVAVSFTRTARPEVKRNLTEQEAQYHNAGKLTNPGNIQFTYLLKEDEADPESFTLSPATAGPGTSPFAKGKGPVGTIGTAASSGRGRR